MLTIRCNGIDYRNLISATVVTSIKTVCGAFTITTTADGDDALPIKKGDRINVLADLEPICNGFVDAVEVSYSADGHTITLSGRDSTQDLVDSTVGKRKEFKGGIGLVSLIESVLADLGDNDIKVINRAGFIPAFSSSEVSSAKVGQGAFEFIESYARKRQVLVTTDGSGNVILLRGGSTDSGVRLVNLKGDRQGTNNILSSNFKSDDSQRFSRYLVQTQGNPLFGLSDSKSKNLTQSSASATDDQVRNSRVLEFESRESMSAADIANRVKWEANLRRAQSLKYSVVVQGHTLNGKTWRFNQLVDVVDEFCDLDSTLLISDVTYSYSLDSGSTCQLDMTYPDAYTLEENLASLSKNTKKIGEKFGLSTSISGLNIP